MENGSNSLNSLNHGTHGIHGRKYSGLNGLNSLNDSNSLNGLMSESPGELTVRFKDLSSTPAGEIISREWSFGDGSKSEEKEPEHTYKGSEGDTFTVSLTVRNAEGLDTVTKPAFVSIKTSIIPGFIKGKVTDKGTGDVISGATIAINSTDREIASVETTNDGLYFMQLPSGDYDITAAKEGFSDFSKNVSIRQSETVTVDIKLTEGSGEGGTGEVAFLAVTPETALSSLRKQTAVVTALDADGNPVSGVAITAKAGGTNASVSPASKNTDKNGEAVFKFRFGLIGNDGKIRFTADGLETAITQE